MKYQAYYSRLKMTSLTCFFILALGLVLGHNPPLPLHDGNGNGHIQELNTHYRLYNILPEHDLEGYQEMLSGSEFFSYPSIREDINVSMIARATSGKMGFEFLTGKVPSGLPV
jgi:alpha-mannosidase